MKYDLFHEQQDLFVSTTMAKDTKWLAGLFLAGAQQLQRSTKKKKKKDS